MRRASGYAEPTKRIIELKMFGKDSDEIEERTEREALSGLQT